LQFPSQTFPVPPREASGNASSLEGLRAIEDKAGIDVASILIEELDESDDVVSAKTSSLLAFACLGDLKDNGFADGDTRSSTNTSETGASKNAENPKTVLERLLEQRKHETDEVVRMLGTSKEEEAIVGVRKGWERAVALLAGKYILGDDGEVSTTESTNSPGNAANNTGTSSEATNSGNTTKNNSDKNSGSSNPENLFNFVRGKPQRSKLKNAISSADKWIEDFYSQMNGKDGESKRLEWTRKRERLHCQKILNAFTSGDAAGANVSGGAPAVPGKAMASDKKTGGKTKGR